MTQGFGRTKVATQKAEDKGRDQTAPKPEWRQYDFGMDCLIPTGDAQVGQGRRKRPRSAAEDQLAQAGHGCRWA